MSYFKTLILFSFGGPFLFFSFFCFFSVSVFADFTTNDRETLNNIWTDVHGINEVHLPGIGNNAYEAMIAARDAREASYETRTKVTALSGTTDSIYYQTEEILNAIELLSINSGASCPWSSSDVDDLLKDVGLIEYNVDDIKDDVGDIFTRLKLIEKDTGHIVSYTEDIKDYLSSVPAFTSSSLENQQSILAILNALKVGIVGNTQNNKSIYDLVLAITNSPSSSSSVWGSDDVVKLLEDVGYIKTDVSSISGKVGSIFDSLSLVGIDVKNISDDTDTILEKLSNLPTYLDSSSTIQKDILDILTSLNVGILGDSENNKSLYSLIESITNRVFNSSYSKADLNIIEDSLSDLLTESRNFYKSTFGSSTAVDVPLYTIFKNLYNDIHSVTNHLVSSDFSLINIYSDLHAITNTIKDIEEHLFILEDTVEMDEDISYLRVSNIAQNVTSPIDLSILTNAILGSAFVSPFSADWNSYYDLFNRYKNGEIDADSFIAEMGIYNWFAGLNFADWFVTQPDDEDPENMERWGIVDQAKILWAPLAENTAFPPYEISDARYFLYGTRDLTDNSTNLEVIAYNTSSNLVLALRSLNFAITNYHLTHTIASNTRQLHNISQNVGILKDNFIKLLDIIEKRQEELDKLNDNDVDTPTDLDKLADIPDDIIPESNEQLTGVSSILETDVENDQYSTSVANFINDIKNQFDPFSGSAEKITLTFDAGLLGTSRSVSIDIEQLPKAKAMIGSVTDYMISGWKIAVMIFIVSATAQTLMSDGQRIIGMYE